MPRLFCPIQPVPGKNLLDLGLLADAVIRLLTQGKTIAVHHILKPDESTDRSRDHALSRIPERAEGAGT
jgi:hypothetical protein